MQKLIASKTGLGIYSKLCCMCIAGLFAFSFANNSGGYSPTIKNFAPRHRRDIIKIYPNPSSNGTIHIASNQTDDKELQFYVFDIEGTLMHNIKLSAKTKKTITGLQRGVYMYDVFSNDESIERGKIIVK
jgi:hypothetical protein